MLDAAATQALLNCGELNATALTEIYLEAIQRLNPSLNCYVHVDYEGARAAAAAADQRRRRGRVLSPLDGIPVAVKDNIAVQGWPTSGGFSWRVNERAGADAAVIKSLRHAGAVLLGATNLDEAALGASTNNDHFGACQNPLREGYTAGGSSGGSACAVRAGLAVWALGSDTMGSVRIPASYCGVVGFKPSYNTLAMDGVVPLWTRLDHLGFMVRRCADLTTLLSEIAGVADADTSLPKRLGVLRLSDRVELTPPVAAAFQQALDRAVEAGYHLVEVDGGDYDPGRTRRAGFLLAERALFDWLSARRRGLTDLSPAVARMVDYGARQTEVKLTEAAARLEHTVTQAQRWLADCDVLVSPTTPQPAFPFNGPIPDSQADFTVIANLTGWPAVSLPADNQARGLPAGLQLMTGCGQDQLLARLAATLEAAAPALPAGC